MTGVWFTGTLECMTTPGQNSQELRPIHLDGNLIAYTANGLTHREKHQYVRAYCQETIEVFRHRVGIEPMWSVEVVVKCPSQMGKHEASIWWDMECWYASLEVGCQHSEEMLEWLCIHELVELRRYRTSSHYFEVHELLVEGYERDRLLKQFHQARNQEIEAEVYQLLGKRRPFHMREESSERG